MFNISASITPVAKQGRGLSDLYLSIYEEYRRLLYVERPRYGSVPIAYIQQAHPGVDAVCVADDEELLGGITFLENSARARKVYRFAARSFSLNSGSALITDVLYRTGTGREQPLYYKHVLEDGFLSEPQLLDRNRNVITDSVSRILVTSDEVAIYHGYENRANIDAGLIEARYVSYTDGTGQRRFDLLRSDPAFTEATVFDALLPGKRTYSVRRRSNRYDYAIIYNGPGPYYVKVREEDQIKITTPDLYRMDEPWYIAIRDSDVYAESSEGLKRYFIPEYHYQQFSPVEPQLAFVDVRAEVLDTNHVLLPFRDIDPSEPLQVVVVDTNGSPVYGWTTEETSETRIWIGEIGDRDGGRKRIAQTLLTAGSHTMSFDPRSGIVFLPAEMEPGYRVFAKGIRAIDEYQYRDLDVNPALNSEMVDGTAVVYCVPEDRIGSFQRAIHHFIVNKEDEIVSWTDSDLGIGGVLIPGLTPLSGETALDAFRREFPDSLVIGLVSASREQAPEEMYVEDVRRHSILRREYNENMSAYCAEYPEIQWLVDDTLSQHPVPMMGGLVVQVPYELLDEAGGNLRREDVESRVMRHMAAGSYPFIEYYGREATIHSLEYNDSTNELTIRITETYDFLSYNLYLDDPSTGNYQISSISFSDDPSWAGYRVSVVDLSGYADVLDLASVLGVRIAGIENGYEAPSSNSVTLDMTTQSASVLAVADTYIVTPATMVHFLNTEIVSA